MNKIRAKVYAVIFWQSSIGDILNKFYDLKIFFKYSFHNKLKTKKNYEGYLTKQYHILEKGLALPNTRENFGAKKIEELLKVSDEYFNKFGHSELLHTIATVLQSYLNFNSNFKTFNPNLYHAITKTINKFQTREYGGTKLIDPIIFPEYESFVKNRSSVRIFNNKEVEYTLIEKAIEIAKYSPSVCNRQAWKVHLFDKNKTEKLLKFQDGNNGFGDKINKLIIITSDSRYFTKLESNQIYIDGGLFSMNLILALHSLGIGSCCLNLCVPYVKEIEIKKVAQIDPSERLIMMIGIGHFDKNTKVAFSKKINTSDILNYKS